MLQGGSGETHFFSDGVDGEALVGALLAAGLVVVQPMWDANWALVSEPLGPAVVACREATVVRHVYDAVYAPLGRAASGRSCGFCLGGQSSGSSVFAYALNRYGLAPIVDKVVFASGRRMSDSTPDASTPTPWSTSTIPSSSIAPTATTTTTDPASTRTPRGRRRSNGTRWRRRVGTALPRRRPTSSSVTTPTTPSCTTPSSGPRELWTNNTKVSVSIIADMPHNVRDSVAGRAAFLTYLTS